jgi:hypothetical protein
MSANGGAASAFPRHDKMFIGFEWGVVGLQLSVGRNRNIVPSADGHRVRYPHFGITRVVNGVQRVTAMLLNRVDVVIAQDHSLALRTSLFGFSLADERSAPDVDRFIFDDGRLGERACAVEGRRAKLQVGVEAGPFRRQLGDVRVARVPVGGLLVGVRRTEQCRLAQVRP